MRGRNYSLCSSCRLCCTHSGRIARNPSLRASNKTLTQRKSDLRQAPILGRLTSLSKGKSVGEKAGLALQQNPLDVRIPTRKSYRHDSFTSLSNGMVRHPAW